ncbi:glutamine amidotransferase [Schaalia sp. ZJ405]|uniref:type 1 glutamine amidotransferase n=1 Tax=unclassified Schaalia TaxID=2691889 RepID=UPI0013EC469D|nr:MULTISPECIES: glutamine amidotransferase [unclassified Schaalia]QPK81065.1 glutamine amidotransferase [Schaalia sp. ZJ405]
MSDSTLSIGVLLPEVLGTYGDTGNAVVLRERARRRGIDATIVTVSLADPIPSGLDIYTLGGGEDVAQSLAASKLRDDDGLVRAVEAEHPLLAICASLQVLGHSYRDARNVRVPGLGILDVTTEPQGRRSIGELITEPLIEGLTQRLTGFENHGGATILGPNARPLGAVISGSGNGVLPGDPAPATPVDGVVQGSIIATYMHGPVLARNPELADYLIAQAMGISPTDLKELNIPSIDALRRERLDAGLTSPTTPAKEDPHA